MNFPTSLCEYSNGRCGLIGEKRLEVSGKKKFPSRQVRFKLGRSV